MTKILKQLILMAKLGLFCTLLGFLPISFAAYGAAIDIHDFSQLAQGDVKEARYRQFIDELRCPKCQNQNLSGSNSPIAQDLRRELFKMVVSGDSDQNIKDFMVQRYGNFVLYEPPINKYTLALWAAPGLFLLIIIFGLLLNRRQKQSMGLELNDQEQIELKSIIRRYS